MIVEERERPTFSLRLPVSVEWHTDRYIVRHDALTESIGANGALVRVFSSNPPGETLVLRNPESGQQIPARIIASVRAADGNSFMLRLEVAQSLLESWLLTHPDKQ